MDGKIKEKICKLIDAEIDKIVAMPQLNDKSLSDLHTLTDTKKNLLKIEKLEYENDGMYEDPGYSRDGSYRRGMNSYRQNGYGGNSNRNQMIPPIYYGNSYDDYSMTGGYSRDQGGDSYSHLEEAMRHATSEEERNAIRQLMSRLYK